VGTRQVFVSYSRSDGKVLGELAVLLGGLFDEDSYWLDHELEAGDRWRHEIEAALELACIGVLLVSPQLIWPHLER